MFQIKDFASITASMLNWMRATQTKVTDFNVGSVARTLVESPAVEIEELYQQYFIGLREAIPVATFLSFGFDKLPPATAVGVVNIAQADAREESLLIPEGTVFTSVDGREYSSIEDVTWEVGDTYVRVRIQSSLPGSVGNVDAGSITSSSFFDDTVTIINQALTTGKDIETDAEQEARFADFIASLSRGTNEAIRYVARRAMIMSDDGWIEEYAVRVGLTEIPGRTTVYLYSSIGTPSDELIEQCQRAIDGYHDTETGLIVPGYRPAGVQVDVVSMAEREINLSAGVVMLPGRTLSDEVTQSLRNIFDSVILATLPGDTLYISELTELMLAVPSVKQVVIASTENIICQQNEVLIPGALTVSAL